MPSATQTCRDLQNATAWPRESLIQLIADGLAHLGLTLRPGLRISFCGSCLIPLYELNHRDITKPLQYFARQRCYTEAAKSHERTFAAVRTFSTQTCPPFFTVTLDCTLIQQSLTGSTSNQYKSAVI